MPSYPSCYDDQHYGTEGTRSLRLDSAEQVTRVPDGKIVFMMNRTCLGCGVELTGEVITMEHALPQWLAKEIEKPGVKLRHFLHDENKPEDTPLGSHGLNKFGAKKG